MALKNKNAALLCASLNIHKAVYSPFSTCSDFDSLRCEPPVDVIDEYVPLLFCQIQPVQDGGITVQQKKQQKSTLAIEDVYNSWLGCRLEPVIMSNFHHTVH